MWRSIEFTDCSNDYISKNNDNFARMLWLYDLEPLRPVLHGQTIPDFRATQRPRRLTAYADRKEALRDFAVDWSYMRGKYSESWSDVADWGDFFETYGRRYGLLSEFRSEGTC